MAKHARNTKQSVVNQAVSGFARDLERRTTAMAFFHFTPRPVQAKPRLVRPLSIDAIGALAIIQSRAVFADGHYWLNEALQGIGYVVREVLRELKRHKLIACPARVWIVAA